MTKACEDVSVEYDSDIICSTKFVGLRIPKCAFVNAHIEKAYLGFDLEGDSAPFENCTGRDEGDFRYFDALEGCGTLVETNDTHITYTNHVAGKYTFIIYTHRISPLVSHGEANAVISRKRGIHVDFVCAIANEATVSLDNDIQPLASNVVLDLGIEETSFDLHMGLFNHNFTNQLNSDVEIVVPQFLHIRLHTNDIEDDSFKLKVRECYATPRYSYSSPIVLWHIS